jgi:hypothetical protein
MQATIALSAAQVLRMQYYRDTPTYAALCFDLKSRLLTRTMNSGIAVSPHSSSAPVSVFHSALFSRSFCSSDAHGLHLLVSVSVQDELGKNATT